MDEENHLVKLAIENVLLNRRISELKYKHQKDTGQDYGNELDRLNRQLNLNELILYDIY